MGMKSAFSFDNLTRKSDDLQKQLDKVSEERDDFKNQLNQNQQEIDELKFEIGKMTNMSNTGDGVLKHYYGQSKLVKSKLSASNDALAKTTEELSKIQNEHTNAELNATKLKTDYSKAQSQIRSLELQIKSLNDKNQRERGEYELMIHSQKKEIQDLKQEMDTMQRKSLTARQIAAASMQKQKSVASVKMESARSSKVADPMSTRSSAVNLPAATRSSVAEPSPKVTTSKNSAATASKKNINGSQNSIANKTTGVSFAKSKKHVIKSNENVYGSNASVSSKKRAVKIIPKDDTKLSREQLNLHRAVVASNKSLNKGSTRSIAQPHWTF